MIEDLVLEVVTRLELDLSVLEPHIAEPLLEDLDLGWGTNLNIGEGLASIIIK